MTRVRLHHDQLTLPRELRQELAVSDDEELEAEVVDQGVLLKRSDRARKWAAYQRIRAIQGRGKLSPELAALPSDQLEQRIVELLEADEADRKAAADKTKPL